jgi:tripartite-type tricarboxylate transporter receptor subunit TctC
MRLLMSVVVSLLCVTLANTPSSAQDKYPGRAVKLIVPYGPGGTTDIVARILAEELKNRLGQPFVVENKPGADGVVAVNELVRSGGDGYAFLVGNVTTNAIVPILYASKMSVDYERQVVPVMRLVDVPAFLIATTRNFSPATVSELIAYAKENPNKLNFATTGIGGYPHLDMALFAKRAGDLHMSPVPNKGGASGMINDLLTGTVQVGFINVASTAGNVKAGSLRALAVVNHARLPAFPDVPTMTEAGYPGVGTIAWQGLFASAAAPTSVLERIRVTTALALQTPSVRQALQQQDFNIIPTDSLEQSKSWFAGEMANWRKTAQEVDIEMPNQ